MTGLDWLSVAAGVALAVVVIVDVFLTTVHPDMEGHVAQRLQREVWRMAMALGGLWGRRRRGLMALAGSVMTVLTFAVWIGLFIFAFALIFWPFLSSYRVDPELGRLGFIDAIYYAGTTVTALGYGDVTPLRGGLKVLAFVASGMGFALFTGIVAYMIELLSGVDERNRLALRVHDETDGEERGASLVIRSVGREEIEDLRERYDDWASIARSVQDRLHRYAFVSIFYRSREPIYDPEPVLRVAAEATMAGYLLGADERWRRLLPAVEHLDLAVTRLLGTIAEQYLGQDVTEALASPSPTEEDRWYVESVRNDLRRGLGDGDACGSTDNDEPALALAFRCRTCLTRLDRVTGWSQDGRFEPGWCRPARSEDAQAPATGA